MLFSPLTSSEGLLCLFPGATLSFLAGDEPGVLFITKVVAASFSGMAKQILVSEDKGFFSCDGEDEAEVEGEQSLLMLMLMVVVMMMKPAITPELPSAF